MAALSDATDRVLAGISHRRIDDHPAADPPRVDLLTHQLDDAHHVTTLDSRELERNTLQPAVASGPSAVPYAPSRLQISVLFSAAALTRINTMRGPAAGTGQSARISTASGPPWCIVTAAVIV